MKHETLVEILVQLAEAKTLEISAPSVADVRAKADEVVAAWPGTTYHVTPDPVRGRIVAQLTAPVGVHA